MLCLSGADDCYRQPLMAPPRRVERLAGRVAWLDSARRA